MCVRVANGTAPTGLKEFYKADVRVAAAPNFAFGFGTTLPVITNTVTVTAAGGTPPYTHSWSVDDPSVTINTRLSASTTFGARPSFGDTISATATDTVTDATGALARVQVAVSIGRNTPGGKDF